MLIWDVKTCPYCGAEAVLWIMSLNRAVRLRRVVRGHPVWPGAAWLAQGTRRGAWL